MGIKSFTKYGPRRKMRKYSARKDSPEKQSSTNKNTTKKQNKGQFTKERVTKLKKKKKYRPKIKLNRLAPSITEDKDIIKLLEGFVEWAQLPESLIAEEYPLKHNVSPFVFRRLHERNEDFAYLYWLGISHLAIKRQKLALTNDINYKAWDRYLHMYDPDILTLDKEKAQWSKSDQEQEGNITVVIPDIANKG